MTTVHEKTPEPGTSRHSATARVTTPYFHSRKAEACEAEVNMHSRTEDDDDDDDDDDTNRRHSTTTFACSTSPFTLTHAIPSDLAILKEGRRQGAAFK